MKPAGLLITLFLLLSPVIRGVGQHAIQKNIGTTGYEECWEIAPTLDSMFVTAGYTINFTTNDNTFWIIKLDTAGNIIWKREYIDTNNFNLLYSVKTTTDSGYIAAGRIASRDKTNMDLFIVKFDKTGNLLWTNIVGTTTGGGADETANEIIPTSDGGYFAIGNTYGLSAGLNDFFAVKTDASGKVEWAQAYGGSGNDNAYGAKQTADSGFILAGLERSFGAGDINALLIKIDKNGSVQWAKSYGGADDDRASAIILAPGGGYVVAGVTGSFGAGNYDCFILKLDDNGNILWNTVLGGAGADWAWGIENAPGETYLAGAISKSFGSGAYDYLVFRLDKKGTLLSSKVYGATGDDILTDIEPIDSNYFLAVGYSSSSAIGSYDAFIVKSTLQPVSYGCKEILPNIQVIHPSVTPKSVIPTTLSAWQEATANNREVSFLAERFICPAPPIVIDSIPDTTLCKGNKKTIIPTIKGGSGTFLYGWHIVGDSSSANISNANSLSIIGDSTVKYRLVVTDANDPSNIDTAEFIITVISPVSVAPMSDTTFCTGHKATFSATVSGGAGPYQYLWFGINAGQKTLLDTGLSLELTVISPKSIRFIAVGVCAQQKDSTGFNIGLFSTPKVNLITTDSICPGDTFSAKASTTGGIQPYKYEWYSKENATKTHLDTGIAIVGNLLQPTTIQVIVKDECPLSIDSAERKINIYPTGKIELGNDTTLCLGDSLIISTMASGISTNYFQWEANGIALADTTPFIIIHPVNNATYKVSAEGRCSVKVMDSIKVSVVASTTDFTVVPDQGCVPLTVYFKDLSTGNDSLLNVWDIGGNVVEKLSSFSHTITTVGSHSITLHTNNAAGCRQSVTKKNVVTVWDFPIAAFAISPSVIEEKKEITLSNRSLKATNYYWNFGDGNTLFQSERRDTAYTYNEAKNYQISLVAENRYGCTDTFIQHINVYSSPICIIPNAFTPGNRDRLNDFFGPVCEGLIKYKMTIYNRWGEAIHECEDCQWDGTYYNKPVPEGVYFYLLRIYPLNTKNETIYGTVNVLR